MLQWKVLHTFQSTDIDNFWAFDSEFFFAKASQSPTRFSFKWFVSNIWLWEFLFGTQYREQWITVFVFMLQREMLGWWLNDVEFFRVIVDPRLNHLRCKSSWTCAQFCACIELTKLAMKNGCQQEVNIFIGCSIWQVPWVLHIGEFYKFHRNFVKLAKAIDGSKASRYNFLQKLWCVLAVLEWLHHSSLASK